MSHPSDKALALDHLVLPTQSLEFARERLEALGFTVAPEGVHPFGTRNACVYFSDGTFLEPLAFGDAALRRQAERDGNVFILGDSLFRERIGQEGFSAVVFATADASADHERFVRAGISGGDELFFSRPFADASGKSDTASFKLAFAAGRNEVPFFFACERVNAPSVDRSTLQDHGNGAVGIAALTMSAKDPAAAAELVAEISGAAVADTAKGIRLGLPNARIDILSGEAKAGPDAGGISFDAITFGVRDLKAARGLFSDRGIQFQNAAASIAVPAAPGQGAVFIFEELR